MRFYSVLRNKSLRENSIRGLSLGTRNLVFVCKYALRCLILSAHWGQRNISWPWEWRVENADWGCETAADPGTGFCNLKPDVLWQSSWFSPGDPHKACPKGWARIYDFPRETGDPLMWGKLKCLELLFGQWRVMCPLTQKDPNIVWIEGCISHPVY